MFCQPVRSTQNYPCLHITNFQKESFDHSQTSQSLISSVSLLQLISENGGLNIVEGQDFLYIPFPFMNVQGNCTDNRMGNRARGQVHSTDSPKKKKRTTANVLAFSLYEGRQCGRTFPAWEKPRLNIINSQFQGLGLTGVEQQFEYPLWFSKFFNLPSFEDYFLCNLRVDSMISRNNVKTFQLTSM